MTRRRVDLSHIAPDMNRIADDIEASIARRASDPREREAEQTEQAWAEVMERRRLRGLVQEALAGNRANERDLARCFADAGGRPTRVLDDLRKFGAALAKLRARGAR